MRSPSLTPSRRSSRSSVSEASTSSRANDGLHPVEVNPRWSASMELIERAHGISMFAIHADACAKGELPQFVDRSPEPPATHGKAIVFARQDVVVGDTRAWLEDPNVSRCAARQGDHIAAGQPICTVFAAGSDEGNCHARLVDAGCVYAVLVLGELGLGAGLPAPSHPATQLPSDPETDSQSRTTSSGFSSLG